MKTVIIYSLLSLAAAIGITGCSTSFVGEPTNQPAQSKPGLQYYLPEDVVEVVVTLETTKKTSLEENTSSHSFEKKVTSEVRAIGAEINIQTIADVNHPYTIDASGGALKKNNTALTTSEIGLLQSVNAKSTGSGGVLVDNVMKIAGTALPLLTGIPTGLPKLADIPQTTNPKIDFSQYSETFRIVGNIDANFTKATCDKNYISTKYFLDSDEYKYAFNSIPDSLKLFSDFCETASWLKEREAGYKKASQEIDNVKDEKSLDFLTKKQEKIKSAYADALNAHIKSREAITTLVDQEIKKIGLGTEKEQFKQRAAIDFSNIPKPSDINDIKSESDIPSKGASVWNLYKQTKIIVTALPLDGKTTSDTFIFQDCNGSSKVDKEGKSDINSEGLPCIYYRRPQTFLLSAWTFKSTPDDTQGLIQIDSKIIDAIPKNAPAFALALKESSFAKRDTTLTFSTRGRLTGLTRDYSSAAEDASSAVATGLQGGLEKYKTTLNDIKTIRDTQGQIELQPLQQQLAIANAQSELNLQPIQAQITMAQKQVALINSQTTLQSTNQGQAVALQTQLTDIQNTLLAAQTQLENSQAGFLAAQNSALKSVDGSELARSSSYLQAQIQQTRSEIELIKIRQELEALKNGNTK